MAKLIREFVHQGGVLYVTGHAYNFVEQAFPEFINFAGSQEVAPGDPEPIDAANVGQSGSVMDATILDPSLRDYLASTSIKCHGGEPCLSADGTAVLTPLATGWSVMDGLHPGADVKFYLKGRVTTYYQAGVDKKLAASFRYGDGKVILTSYVTDPGSAGQDETPESRIFDYLITH